MAHQRYLLPLSLTGALLQPCAQGLRSRGAVFETDGFKVMGMIVHGPKDVFERFIAEAEAGTHAEFKKLKGFSGLQRAGIGTVDGESLEILSVEPLVTVGLEGGDMLHDLPQLAEDIRATLKWLAHVTGLMVRHYAPRGETLRPSPVQPGECCIIIDAAPPYDPQRYRAAEIGGVTLASHGEGVKHIGPARGCGAVVENEMQQAVAQIADRMLYLFVPLRHATMNALLSHGGGLFKDALRRAWNAQYENHVPVHEALPLGNQKQFVSVLEGVHFAKERSLHGDLADIDFEIERVKGMLQELHQRRAYTLKALELQDLYELSQREQMAKDWERIATHPRLERVTYYNTGLHFETVPLVLQHEDAQYDLGRFVIRLNVLSDSLALWAKEPVHRGGRHHPHIGDSGMPCFGNVTAAIEQAQSEYRYADLIDLVLAWLEDAYEPELAETPIQEWPRLQTLKEVA